MFHRMFVHHTFSSVWIAEWPPFGKLLPKRLVICSCCLLSFCNFYLFPISVLRDLAFDCYSPCSLPFYYFFRDRAKRRLCFAFFLSRLNQLQCLTTLVYAIYIYLVG